VVVIGAGPAGLATSAMLMRRGVSHRVLERGDAVGHTWAHLYDGLVLHTSKELSSLPGLGFSKSVPRFPSRREFVDYLRRYADALALPIETGITVTDVARDGDSWVVTTNNADVIQTRSLVVATGIVANPYEPRFAGRETYRGRVLHAVQYQRADPFTGQRVVVVGAGNSSGDIAVELARAGARVTLSVRSGATVVPREIAGVPIQYLSLVVGALPPGAQRLATRFVAWSSSKLRGRPVLPPAPPSMCPRVPIVGFHLADAIASGAIELRAGLAAFTLDGVRFEDGAEVNCDVVILATGYRAALGVLAPLIQLDSCGFAQRRDRVRSSNQPDLYFVGHNYGIRGGLFNIGRDARLVARLIGGD
jgi:cation diffusion facilitator CzcD-associated flavoprotein CzcO